MTFTQLLAKIGDDKIKFQWLSNCISGATKLKKGGSQIKFETDAISPGDIVKGFPDTVGIIVWVPRKDLDQTLPQ